jgi:hypothetical protein
VHRGAGTVKPGDPIWMIETIFAQGHPDQYSKFKTFPSLQGFKAGLRAVKDQIASFNYTGAASAYKTYVVKPSWQSCDDDGEPV